MTKIIPFTQSYPMNYVSLAPSLPDISTLCLGTMSFGAHVDETEAWKIMDCAMGNGINFFDTAELYAVPVSEETFGETERIIGRWMKERGNRDDIVIASKVIGGTRPGHTDWIREGNSSPDEKNIRAALEGSLQRMQIETIDLYQIHWPDRAVNKFGERNFITPSAPDTTSVQIEETLRALQKMQQEGKIKEIGISNETPWGTMEYIRVAKEMNLPLSVSIQNNYSLLTRSYETGGMAEITYREGMGLLAYSPLGYGAIVEEKRNNGRFDVYPDFVPRYQSPEVQSIVDQYKTLAHAHDMTVSEMAIAFVMQQPFVKSTIIGPATVAQLEESIGVVGKKLSQEVLDGIEIIHEQYPNICP